MSASFSTRPHRVNRRRFLQATAIAGAVPIGARDTHADASGLMQRPQAGGAAVAPTAADVGTLFPFIQNQAAQGPFPMSFTNPQFRSLEDWTATARAKVLDLLHYAPPPCDPRAEVFERVDRGDYVREKVFFNTTPDVRVPAYVLVPKGPRPERRPRRSWPCTTTAASTCGARRSSSRSTRAPGPHRVQGALLRRAQHRHRPGRRGYVVVVIDMFYWGERRMLLDDDPADWRDRPSTMAPERVQAFNRARARRATRRPHHLHGRLHLARRDVLGRHPHRRLPADPAGRGPEAHRLRRALGRRRASATWRRWTNASRLASSSAGWRRSRDS